ncbi:Arrestin domain-containing protein 17 [Lamellibrachia satsuma]|nr:Arrestin domain-containing protein 17 [Lamellibrachia satsuma]
MLNSCVYVQLSREDATYNAGDVISGVVCLQRAQKLKIKDVSVHIHGSARVSWSERRSFTRGSAWIVSHRNTENYLDHVIHLQQPDSESQASGRPSVCLSLLQLDVDDSSADQQPEDVKKYQFRFTLPASLPSSFDGKWGQIHYGVKVIFDRHRKRRIEQDTPFCVIGAVDVNKEPEMQVAATADGDFKAGLLCCGGGPVGVQLAVSRRGYTVGDTVEFRVDVDNQSRKKLHEVKVALVQHVMFRVGSLTRRTTKMICSVTRGETAPNSTHVWEGGLLDIPEVVPTCRRKLIQIKYTVTLFINYSTWANDYALLVPVVIGTVPMTLSHRASFGSSVDGVFMTGRYNGSAILYSSTSPICAAEQRRQSEAVLVLLKAGRSGNLSRSAFASYGRQTSLPDEHCMAMAKRKQKLNLSPLATSAQALVAPQEQSEVDSDVNSSTTGLT